MGWREPAAHFRGAPWANPPVALGAHSTRAPVCAITAISKASLTYHGSNLRLLAFLLFWTLDKLSSSEEEGKSLKISPQHIAYGALCSYSLVVSAHHTSAWSWIRMCHQILSCRYICACLPQILWSTLPPCQFEYMLMIICLWAHPVLFKFAVSILLLWTSKETKEPTANTDSDFILQCCLLPLQNFVEVSYLFMTQVKCLSSLNLICLLLLMTSYVTHEQEIRWDI